MAGEGLGARTAEPVVRTAGGRAVDDSRRARRPQGPFVRRGPYRLRAWRITRPRHLASCGQWSRTRARPRVPAGDGTGDDARNDGAGFGPSAFTVRVRSAGWSVAVFRHAAAVERLSAACRTAGTSPVMPGQYRCPRYGRGIRRPSPSTAPLRRHSKSFPGRSTVLRLASGSNRGSVVWSGASAAPRNTPPPFSVRVVDLRTACVPAVIARG